VLLLAPAGSFEAATQALSAGADAIYVGLKGWSRGGARTEVDRQQFLQCAQSAHALRKQIHLALNTVVPARQHAMLTEELAELAGAGVDAVIVNDIGLLRTLKRQLPALPVSVSVGCGALNADDVLFYQELGAAAVVLPGYLEPPEIAAIKARICIRIELMLHMVDEFIQLGKCWMPSYLNFAAAARVQTSGRLSGSVKRGGVGSCFRICQTPWSVIKGESVVDHRLFPSRQISRLSELAAFLDAGADVIKIQGRSLPPDALGAVVARYRSAIQAWQSGQEIHYENSTLPAMWTVQGR
jgi:U32 family peptidase